MKIREITEYVTDYVHGDVERQLKKIEKRAKGRSMMGYHSMLAYPYRVEGWSKKYKKSINCSNPKGFSQKAHCAGRKKK
tara:strand:- start:4600 stop:4836 length:237 start_codon:yes stop_codon:yes gene_type:complete